MGLVKEFKEFAMRGNVVDLAVGVIIGAAFGNIVTSLVKDVIMPPIGLATGGIDFKDKVLVLKSAVMEGEKVMTPAVTVNYGLFINALINFLIVAFCIFLIIKAMNKAMPKASPPPPPGPTKEQVLLTEIRDALVRR
jgi:large conductance mechanosensitive channel